MLTLPKNSKITLKAGCDVRAGEWASQPGKCWGMKVE